MRILFATHAEASSTGAVYRSTTTCAQYLQRRGHLVEVLTPRDLLGRRSPRFDPVILPPLLARRRLSRFDVVIFHSYLGWAFHVGRRWLDPGDRVTTITWFHGLEPMYHAAVEREHVEASKTMSLRFRMLHRVSLPRMLKASCRASDAVFCLNSAEVEYLRAHSWAVPERIFRVANGVEDGCFISRCHRRRARRLLFVGQWLPAKGIRYLLDAFSALSARRDLELSCVGTGIPEAQVLADFPQEHRARVRVRSAVDRTDLYNELARADVFLFPTLSEGFSLALLEAMASELPIVTTRVGAAVDLLESDRNAVLVGCGDVQGLIDGVERLVDDLPMREALGAAAGRTATSYKIETTSARFADCVSEVVGRHPGQSTGCVHDVAC